MPKEVHEGRFSLERRTKQRRAGERMSKMLLPEYYWPSELPWPEPLDPRYKMCHDTYLNSLWMVCYVMWPVKGTCSYWRMTSSVCFPWLLCSPWGAATGVRSWRRGSMLKAEGPVHGGTSRCSSAAQTWRRDISK